MATVEASGVPGAHAHLLLDRWREAERRWNSMGADAAGWNDAALDVVQAWLAYQVALGSVTGDDVLLVLDDGLRVVAASGMIEAVLGYRQPELMDHYLTDFVDSPAARVLGARWRRLRETGRQTWLQPVMASDGRNLCATFEVQADFPIAGFHLCRVGPATAASTRS